MSSTYFPLKPLLANGLASDVTQLVTTPLTVLRGEKCYKYSLKLTDISSDFKDTNIKRVAKAAIFFTLKKLGLINNLSLFENNVVINTYKYLVDCL